MNKALHELTDEEFEEFNNKIKVAASKSKKTESKATMVRSQESINEYEDIEREAKKANLKGGMYSNDVVDHSLQTNHDIFKPLPKQNTKSVWQEKAEDKAKEEAKRLKNRESNKRFAEALKREQSERDDIWD